MKYDHVTYEYEEHKKCSAPCCMALSEYKAIPPNDGKTYPKTIYCCGQKGCIDYLTNKGFTLESYVLQIVRVRTPQEIENIKSFNNCILNPPTKEPYYSSEDIRRAKQEKLDRQFEEFHNIDKWTKGYSW